MIIYNLHHHLKQLQNNQFLQPTLHQIQGWSQTLHQFRGWKYQYTHHLQNKITNKHLIDCAQSQKNGTPLTASIFIPHGITHVKRLWHKYSYRIMMTILHTSTVQSLMQKKPMILSALNILSSGKLYSQMISSNYHKVLVTT